VIHPTEVEAAVVTRDIPLMIGLSVALLLMAYGFRGRGGRINRIQGAVLVAVYIGYQGLLYFTARH
jgi:cation:H+ antiporter